MSKWILRKVDEITFQDTKGTKYTLDVSQLNDPVYIYYVAWVDMYTLTIELPEFINLKEILDRCPVEQLQNVLMSFIDREALKQKPKGEE